MTAPVAGSDRIDRLRSNLRGQNLDGALITHLSNLYYFTGFRGSDGALWVSEKRTLLLVDGRYGHQAQLTSRGAQIEVYSDKIKTISDAIRADGARRVGFESRWMSQEVHGKLLASNSGAVWEAMGNWIHAIRAVKDEEELAILREGNRFANEALLETLPFIRPGTSERDVATELEYRMRKKGGEKAAFPILVAGGERTALPHAIATERIFRADELVYVDFGLTHRGYQTDHTVSMAIGKPRPKLKEIYRIVKDAHDAALAEVKPGVAVRDLDNLAREIIRKAGYADRFTHALGHGVGIDGHEFPTLSLRTDDILQAGMVITIEPGIYIPGEGGVRIEDCGAVCQKGIELFTTVDKGFRSL